MRPGSDHRVRRRAPASVLDDPFFKAALDQASAYRAKAASRSRRSLPNANQIEKREGVPQPKQPQSIRSPWARAKKSAKANAAVIITTPSAAGRRHLPASTVAPISTSNPGKLNASTLIAGGGSKRKLAMLSENASELRNFSTQA